MEKGILCFIITLQDEEHVFLFQSPPRSGSMFYNYKVNHSISLLTVCDPITVSLDIGAEGRPSNGGIFANSNFGQMFERN